MTSHYHFAVVGEQIAYSKSSAIFKAALSGVDQSASCDLLSISPDQIEETLQKIRSGYYSGVSITIPYKSAVIEFIDVLDPSAAKLRAVNSICMTDDRLRGFNTDIDGFAYPFGNQSGYNKPASAIVLGNGGAARAVVFSLANSLGCKQIVVLGRSAEKLKKFHSTMSDLLPNCDLSVAELDSLTGDQSKSTDLVVNCTPLGGPNDLESSPLPGWFEWSMTRMYYDINYNSDNKLVKQAGEAGVKALDGSTMLVAQALKSLNLWTSLEIKFDPVYQAVFARQLT